MKTHQPDPSKVATGADACCESVLLSTCCGPEAKSDCCDPQEAPTTCGCDSGPKPVERVPNRR